MSELVLRWCTSSISLRPLPPHLTRAQAGLTQTEVTQVGDRGGLRYFQGTQGKEWHKGEGTLECDPELEGVEVMELTLDSPCQRSPALHAELVMKVPPH